MAFDASRAAPENLLGSGTVSDGAVEFALKSVDWRLSLLVDLNADGACNLGETLLPYFIEFMPSAGLIRFVPASDGQARPCENSLPAR